MNTSNNPIWCWALGPVYIKARARTSWVPSSVFAQANKVIDYFHCRNVVLFPGEVRYTADEFSAFAQYDQVCAQVSHLSEEGKESARALSQLSKQFPNIVGGIVDDFSTAITRNEGTPDDMRQLSECLKADNKSLELNAVCYTMHFDQDLKPYLPYIDRVSLWVWDPADLANLDAHVEEAARRYQKPMHLGLYLFDYGVTGEVLSMEILKSQCESARRYLSNGIIDGIHILGSYTNDEFSTPEAQWLAEFCRTF